MRVLVDTREQKPYEFPDALRETLQTGDYSVLGYETAIALERKAHDDLFGCLSVRRKMFEAQLERLSSFLFPALILDTTPETILFGHAYSQLPGDVALSRLIDYMTRFHVPVIFAGTKGNELAFLFLLSARDACKKELADVR